MTLAQETNGLKIDQLNFRHVEDDSCGVIVNLLTEIFDALGTDPADQP